MIDAYSTQLTDAMIKTFDVMDNYIIDANNLSDWNAFKQNAASVAQETKKNFAQVIAAYVEYNAQYAGKCLPMQPPLQDTIDTSFASFYQK